MKKKKNKEKKKKRKKKIKQRKKKKKKRKKKVSLFSEEGLNRNYFTTKTRNSLYYIQQK